MNPIYSEDCAMDAKEVERLVDWRIGHHVEAGAKLIAGALHRIANAMEEDNVIRREHLAVTLEQRDVANRAAERLLGLGMYGSPMKPVDLREAGDEVKGPEWVKDVIADRDAHTEKQS